MKLRILTIILFISLSQIIELSAQQLVTDRPDQTESSVTVPLRSFQIESGLLIGHTYDNNISERQLLIPTTLLRYGLTKSIEIRIVDQLEHFKDLNNNGNFGISDLEIGAKVQVLKKENINTEMAFLSHLIIPTGTNGFSNDKFGIVNKIAVSHSLNELLGLGYNLGYNYFGYGKGDLIYSVALGIGITEKTGFYVETFGEITGFKDPVSNFDSGLTYLIKQNLQLDLSFGLGLNQKMNYFSIGCSWNIAGKQK